ncbi:exodeoxyribonuclease 7 small subunit [Ktedonobacter sp. SOSP1-85]|uniref:Exodeoxyribonuclease 7 small subunit n=1 Tax=Ktedonobacter racemifer DSM 44963 TaxID=485913 RepID=D6TL17_KTERA|nr:MULTISPECIES: exodeoxyribonuclease VII small subunit [Ktedonobacter]EFH86467.1 exodeoxyribonuclease VII, small subunit [Ktedonobacter racemifer DSM 44963]GHO76185.1 exodeoxyribonuclease 7 small subunit [Ktedonobacter sp. SOSP1-85]
MEALSFEEAFAKLEATVAALKDGQVSLEQALSSYQEGVTLVQYCNELLQKAELTVQQLQVDSEGTLSLQSLDL